MAVETLTTPRTNLPNQFVDVTARELDFVSRFGDAWNSLQEILGIMNPIKKENGTKLVSYKAEITLEDGTVPAGAVIPYSKAKITETSHADLTIDKYAKAVTIEDVHQYGTSVAVQKTDDAFLNELQGNLIDDFYDMLTENTDALGAEYDTFQMAVAMAVGMVKDKFKKIRKNVTDVVVFVNTIDAYKYLGAAELTTQTAFGLDYVEGFMGTKALIVSSEIPEGKVVAIPSENIVLYYVDPATQFAELGLVYTTDGETNLIGFHAQGNYTTAVGESFALMGMKLWLEYADGVCINTIKKATTGGEG